MNPNLIGLLSVGLSFTAFALAFATLSPRNVSARVAAFAVFALLAIPSILFAIYYLHVLPERAWFFTLRSWRGTELLVVFLGIATGASATLLPRLLLILPLSALAVLSVVPYIKPLLFPIAESEIDERWSGIACLQSTQSTCGPASTCTILKLLGAKATEREAAHACHTSGRGTEAWYLARYVRSKGFVARFVFRRTLQKEDLPAVVGVRIGSVGHFIAVLGTNGDEITLADPLRGEERLPISQFQKRYEVTGFRMTITKPPAT